MAEEASARRLDRGWHAARIHSRRQGVQVRRSIQGDNTILEERAYPDTTLGWGAVQSDPGFKAEAVALQEV